MKISPCKDCKDRYLACHDYCDRYKKWKDYVTDTRTKQKLELRSYRSKTTDKKAIKDKKRYSASYMKNKF